MSIVLRNGRYYSDYFPDGRHGRRVQMALPEGITEEEARVLDEQLRSAALKSRSAKASQVKAAGQTVTSLFKKYMGWYEIHRQPRSYQDLESVFKNQISRILGKERVCNISPDHILLYKQIRSKEEVTNRTINKELHYFSGFLKWAARENFIPARTFRIETLPHKRPVPMVLSPEEILAIIQATEPFYRAFFLCLYTLGLRMNEARQLKWEDIDFHSRSVRIQQKGGSWKLLPLPEWTADAIREIPQVEGSPFVFVSRRSGKPVSNVTKAIARACKKAGITRHVHPHLFRHSIATHLMGGNINLRVIQKFLGHAQVGTTEWYTHVALEHFSEASAMIDRMGKRKLLSTGKDSK